jgi:hypothetical protein
MVVYVKEKGKLKTIKEIALEYKLPISLVYSRYNRGIRDLETLITPKYELNKE